MSVKIFVSVRGGAKFTTESHKLLQGDVGELFRGVSAACHKKPLLLNVSGVGLLYRAIETTQTVL